jgi:ABC-type transport system substrate-binding protein
MRIIFAAFALAVLAAPVAAKPPADAPVNSDAAVAPAPAPETTLTPLTPIGEPAATTNKSATSGGSGVFAWLARNGAADWRWLLGAMLALFVFLRLIRRGGGDRPRDLLGPPASMRPGAHPAVTPLPRTPDIR